MDGVNDTEEKCMVRRVQQTPQDGGDGTEDSRGIMVKMVLRRAEDGWDGTVDSSGW